MVSVSALGLLLSGFVPASVHVGYATELLSPMLVRNIVNAMLPWFPPTLKLMNDDDSWLTREDQTVMLDAALKAVCPKSGTCPKAVAAKDYLFLMTFEQRQGSVAFLAGCLAAVYALHLPLAARHPVHFLFFLVAVLMTLINVNHTGVLAFGHNPYVSEHGWWVGALFAPVWMLIGALNFIGLRASVAAAKEKKA